MPLSKNIIVQAAILIMFAALYSCTNNIKYPQYTEKQPTTASTTFKTNTKPKRQISYNSKTAKGIYYLKLHKCKKAIHYFKSLGNSFLSEYCLFISYGYCSHFKNAKKLFGRLENKNINNTWQAKIYASYGLFSMINKQKRFRDYLSVAYAYDANNRLARELLIRKHITKNDKQRFFREIFMWCSGK